MRNNIEFSPLQVIVKGSLNKAIEKFNKLCAEDGLFDKLKEKRAYEKPSAKQRRKLNQKLKEKKV